MPTHGAAKAKMKVPAKAKLNIAASPAPTPVVITINPPDGNTTPNPATVSLGGRVQFDNQDTVEHLIRLWSKGGKKHSGIDIVIVAGGSVTMMPDPDAKVKDEFPYNVLPASSQGFAEGPRTDIGGGGGRIIIGS